jgi:hypothetical protein
VSTMAVALVRISLPSIPPKLSRRCILRAISPTADKTYMSGR